MATVVACGVLTCVRKRIDPAGPGLSSTSWRASSQALGLARHRLVSKNLVRGGREHQGRVGDCRGHADADRAAEKSALVAKPECEAERVRPGIRGRCFGECRDERLGPSLDSPVQALRLAYSPGPPGLVQLRAGGGGQQRSRSHAVPEDRRRLPQARPAQAQGPKPQLQAGATPCASPARCAQ